MQCGIACLQMVCQYFGVGYSIQELSHLCFATTEGVSLLPLLSSIFVGFSLHSPRVFPENPLAFQGKLHGFLKKSANLYRIA